MTLNAHSEAESGFPPGAALQTPGILHCRGAGHFERFAAVNTAILTRQIAAGSFDEHVGRKAFFAATCLWGVARGLMLTFWLVTGLDDHRWEIIEREDGTRFHRKEGHVLWLAGLPETAPEDRLTPTSMRSNPYALDASLAAIRRP